MAFTVRGPGGLLLPEEAAPAAPASGYGRLYVATDGTLHFQNDAGADTQLGASGGGSDPWTHQALSANYTNSTVTASDVFTGFTPAANTKYIVDVLASVTAAAATTGVQTALAGPTSGITRAAVKIISAASATADKVDHIAALNTFQVATAGLTTVSLLSLQAIVEVGATPGAGNIRLQAKSEVASSAITFYPGSSMRWRTI